MLVFLIVATLAAPACTANDCPLDDGDVRARLAFIEGHLEDGAPRAQAWFATWTATYGTLAVGQGALLLTFHDCKSQVSYLIGGIGAVVGTLSMVVIPMPAAFAAHHLRGLAETTPEERRHKLAAAEHWLDRAADGEQFEKSWLVQLGGVIVSSAFGLILELGYRYFGAAIENTFIGIAIAQTQVTTSPTQAVRDRVEYARRFGLPAPSDTPPLLRFKLAGYPGGLAIVGNF